MDAVNLGCRMLSPSCRKPPVRLERELGAMTPLWVNRVSNTIGIVIPLVFNQRSLKDQWRHLDGTENPNKPSPKALVKPSQAMMTTRLINNNITQVRCGHRRKCKRGHNPKVQLTINLLFE
jgi:hypothetical protein